MHFVPFLLFGMCDETFSINYTAQIPEDVDKGWFYFFVTPLAYSYGLPELIAVAIAILLHV